MNAQKFGLPRIDKRITTHLFRYYAQAADKDREGREEILEEYKGLTREDIQACLLFATESLEDTTFMPLTVEAY